MTMKYKPVYAVTLDPFDSNVYLFPKESIAKKFAKAANTFYQLQGRISEDFAHVDEMRELYTYREINYSKIKFTWPMKPYEQQFLFEMILEAPER